MRVVKSIEFRLHRISLLISLSLLLLWIDSGSISNITTAYEFKCPKDWIEFRGHCFLFVRSPTKNYEEAKRNCYLYNAFLLSVLTTEEHHFITEWLRHNDPIHASWLTSAIDAGNNAWRWDIPINRFDSTITNSGISSSSSSSSSSFNDPNGGGVRNGNNRDQHYSVIAALWLHLTDQNDPTLSSFGNNDLLLSRSGHNAVYNFSQNLNRWGLIRTNGNDYHSFICKMKKEDVTFANAAERDIDYGINVIDQAMIPRGPKFLQEPKDVIFDVSGRSQLNHATLKCLADAYPSPTYKWLKEEYVDNQIRSVLMDPLSDRRYTQTDGTLIIDNPQADRDRGKYHCVAENKFGAIISQTVQLTFGYIGEFTKKRSSDYGREYWGKSISCDPPKHHISVSYHWSRDSFEYIIEDDRRTFVSRDGNLYFSSLEKIDRANYSCNVKSSIASSGRTGPFFPLIVDSASSSQKLLFPNHFPKIFPEIKLAGSEVRLECMAYGYPVPYYNWTRQGSTFQMPEGHYLASFNRVLVIPHAKVEDSGEYVCTATSGKDVISKSVQLAIQSMPIILQHIGNKIVERENEILTWECEAFGIPSVSYSWYKNGVEISDHNRLTLFSDEDRNRYEVRNNVLMIHGLIPERDEGMYQCQATNELGTAFSSGQLRVVRMAPSFRKHPMPTELYAADGGNITIPCIPEAMPSPSFDWYKDYNRLSTIGGRIRVLTNGFLTISPVSTTDEGTYSCVARNLLGTDRTHGFLKVFNRPKFYVRPDPIYERQIGESIELPCVAITDPQLDRAYKWNHNGLRIDFEKMPQYQMIGIDGYLLINNLTLAETGEYECIVQTTIGSASVTTKIQLFAQPGAPGAVMADDITATSARLHWSDGSQNGRRILGYRIEGLTNHEDHWQSLMNSTEFENPFRADSNGRLSVYLNDVLSPWSTYRFRIAAFNEIGTGPRSESSPSYNTEKAVPFKAPSNVGGGGGKAGTLTITWDPLPPKDWNAPDVWYRIFYKAADSYEQPYIDKNLTHLGNIHMYTVNVGDENYYKEYLVRVQAMNSVGAGRDISNPVSVYSAESMPQIAPNGVNAFAYNSTALNVTWISLDTSREKMRGRLIGHRIKYWKMDQNPQYDSLTLLRRGTQPWGLIVGLMPDNEYYIAVMAYNEAGSGPESEPFLARTFKAAPQQPPTSVNVTATNSRSVLVTWRGISSLTNAEEPISGYKVRYWETDQPISRAKEIIKPLDGSDLRTIISDLVPGKVYKLRVLAFSNGGDGKMSQQVVKLNHCRMSFFILTKINLFLFSHRTDSRLNSNSAMKSQQQLLLLIS
ncbi:contactin-like protein [Sarcoptes scabiei]|uniref:Contactin-like protein n=1 Tax=Sarcoptes scabiei TaxID=52283 RepID=A0A132AHK9_SARSC|nr:contactin-like protein [Sarcoptes scabiei]